MYSIYKYTLDPYTVRHTTWIVRRTLTHSGADEEQHESKGESHESEGVAQPSGSEGLAVDGGIQGHGQTHGRCGQTTDQGHG